MTRRAPETLRSARWFAPDDLRSFGHRSRAMQMGYGPADWAGKPVIAIINTWSDINQCHAHFSSASTTSSAACCRREASRSSCRR